MAFSFLATLAHDNGPLTLILVCMLLYEARVKLSRIAVTLVVGGMGLVAFMAYLFHRFHNPLAFVSAQKSQGWVQQGGNIFDHLADHAHLSNYFFLALVVISAFYWWNRRKSFAVYSALYAIVPFAGGIFGGYNRYILMAFTVPWMFYDISRKSRTGYQVLPNLICYSLDTYLAPIHGCGYIGS